MKHSERQCLERIANLYKQLTEEFEFLAAQSNFNPRVQSSYLNMMDGLYIINSFLAPLIAVSNRN